MKLPSALLRTSMDADSQSVRKRIVWSGISLFMGLAVLVLILYLDRDNRVSVWIHSLGPIGIAVAIVLMAVVCLTPLPGEVLLLIDMRVYGVWSGIGVGWLGSIAGSLVAFVIARTIGRSFVLRFVTPAHITAVETWVAQSKTVGLLAVRLLPLPSAAVNYALGLLHAVTLWSYLWTGAVTAIPYYACTGLVYVGIFQRWTVWSVVTIIAVAAAWLLSLIGKRIWKEYRAKNQK